ncbi:MAG: hypothetical protein AAGC88_13580 [Bacteroidota bacterium]
MRSLQVILKMLLRRFILILKILVVISTKLIGQDNSYDRLLAEHDQNIGLEHLGIISGPEYSQAFFARSSHPFYNSSNWVISGLNVNGKHYPEVLIKYDCFQDQLVIGVMKETGATPVVVKKELVAHFSINQLDFTYLELTESGYEGYLGQLFDGLNLSLYLKVGKDDEIDERSNSLEYVPFEKYLLLWGSELIELKGKGSILSLFPEKKTEIKSYIKKERLDLKYKEDLKKLVAFCDSI